MRYRVLGPVEVEADGGMVRLGGRRQRLVLAVLLAHPNEVLGTDRLVDAVWGERPPASARKTVQAYVARLRSLLGEGAVAATADGYRLPADATTLDLLAFEQRARTGRHLLTRDAAAAAVELRGALALWRGVPFGDLGDEPGLAGPTRRLMEQRVEVLEDRVSADLELGQGPGLVAELQELVAEHPLRERLRAQLMVALYRSGRQAEALAVYEQARRLLADELGVDPSPALVTTHERVLRQDAALAGSPRAPPVDDGELRNPYKGLRPFGVDDAADFFGRSSLVEEILAKTAVTALVVVVGASGSGKSSAVMAGVVPRLRTDPSARVAVMVPGAHPFEALLEALSDVTADRDGLVSAFAGDDLDLVRAIQRIPADRLVLVIDQLEELLIAAPEPARARFVRNVVEALDDPACPLSVLAALRADVFDRLLDAFPAETLSADRLVTVPPMTAEEFEQAARAPADRVGVHLEPELMADLVADSLGQPGVLPLFQYALTEVFDDRAGPALTRASYRRLGGIKGALTRRAEHAYASLERGEQEALRQVMLRLVRVGDDTAGSSRRATLTELTSLGLDPTDVETALRAFDRARLLTFDRDRPSGAATVEVAHESLIRQWPRLHGWLDAVRDDLRLRELLAVEMAEWEAAGRDPDYLITGSRLLAYDSWPRPGSLEPTADETAFLGASTAAYQHAVQQRHRAQRRLRVLVAALTVIAIVASGLSVLAYDRGQAARAAARAAQERSLADAALRVVEEDADLAVLLAAQAALLADSSGPQEATFTALTAALSQHRLVTRLDDVADVAFLPDGRLVVGGEQTRIVDPWAPGDTVLLHASGPSQVVAVAPETGLIAAGSLSGTISQWPMESSTDGSPTTETIVGSAPVVGTSFSADGERLATLVVGEGLAIHDTASMERQARRVWTDPWWEDEDVVVTDRGDVALMPTRRGINALHLDGSWTTPVDAPGTHYTGLATAPEGEVVAVALDGSIELLDPEGGVVESWQSTTDALTAVAVSADGRRLLTGTDSGSVHVWDVDGGTLRRAFTFAGRGHAIVDVETDAAGTLMAAVADDGTADVRIVRAPGTGLLGSWPGDGPIAFSPDGTVLAAAAPDGSSVTLVPWGEEETGARSHSIERVVAPPQPRTLESTEVAAAVSTASLSGLSWHPTGQQLVGTYTFSTDEYYYRARPVKVWDLATGEVVSEWLSPRPVLDAAAFTTDGRLAAVSSCGEGTEAWVFDTETTTRWFWGRSTPFPVFFTSGQNACGHSADITADGTRLAVQSDSRASSVRVWDLTESVPLLDLQHMPGESGAARYSPDGTRLLTAGADGAARVWDASTGERVLALHGGGGPVESALWTPDGSLIITGSRDGVVRLWDAVTGERRGEIAAHRSWPEIAVSPDGARLVTSADGTVNVWSLDVAELVDMATDAVTRGLTTGECDRFRIDPCPS